MVENFNKFNIIKTMEKAEILDFFLNGEKFLLATVSGVASTNSEMIRFFNDDVPAVDIITTKSFQVRLNAGNPEPIICEPEIGVLGNSVGLRNPGMKIALSELQSLRAKNAVSKILNVSLSASNPKDFIKLIKNFEKVADMVELNFSCPHAAAGFGSSIGGNLETAKFYVSEIKKTLPNCGVPIFVKLTPNVSNIGEIALACVEAGADGIVAINTVGPELYIEPNSKQAILNNKVGGKGGKSGVAIFETARSAIENIRENIGDKIPIIGMGGVSTGKQAYELICAGANIVGIGSALAKVNQKDWREYFATIKSEVENALVKKSKLEISSSLAIEKSSESFLSKERCMEYFPHTIKKIEYDNADVLILTLDGEIKYKAGEFVFLWLPGVGEKPFSVATSSPFTFMIKRRKNFTKSVFNLKVGDKIYIRGPYGKGIDFPKTKSAILVAGGTGIAVLPKLAEDLQKAGIKVETFVGTSELTEAGKEVCTEPRNVIEKTLTKFGSYTRVADNGTVARVLEFLKNELNNRKTTKQFSTDKNSIAFYIVGPTPFFTGAAKMFSEFGVTDSRIFMSLEKLTRCGVGLCGECRCGKKLTCQYGTFVSYGEYKTASDL